MAPLQPLPLLQQPLDPMPSPLLLPLPPTLPPMELTTTPATVASTEPLLSRAPPPRLLLQVLPLPLPLATLPLPLLQTLLQPLITLPTTLSRDTARRPTSSTTASTTDTRLVPPRLRLHHHQRLLLPVRLARVRTRRHQSLLQLPWLLLLRTILPRSRKIPSKYTRKKSICFIEILSVCIIQNRRVYISDSHHEQTPMPVRSSVVLSVPRRGNSVGNFYSVTRSFRVSN